MNKRKSKTVYHQNLESNLNEFSEIIETVTEYYQINASELYTSSRKTEVKIARNFCIKFIYDIHKVSLQVIADHFNRKTHGAVLNSIRQIDNYVDVYPEGNRIYKQLKFKLSVKGSTLDNSDIYKHLTHIFMTKHTDLFIGTGITKNDVKFLASEFNLDSDHTDKVIKIMENNENSKDRFNKTKHDELNKSKKEIIKNKTEDGQDVFNIRAQINKFREN